MTWGPYFTVLGPEDEHTTLPLLPRWSIKSQKGTVTKSLPQVFGSNLKLGKTPVTVIL